MFLGFTAQSWNLATCFDVPDAHAFYADPANLEHPGGSEDQKEPAKDGPAKHGTGKAGDDGGGKDPKVQKVAVFPMAMSAVAGLVLFLFGVTQLAQGLGRLNSERMRRVLSKFTTNRLAGAGTGIVATTLLESSSVTVIMVIALVSSGALTFVQSLGVVLGANIGTAVGAQIIALKVAQYVPILMLSGLLLLFVAKKSKLKNVGIVLLGFGLMFYGLDAIDEAMKPLRTHEPFLAMMRSLGENVLLGALVGALFTVAVQSSSATVAVVITLAGSGLISLPAGVAIMLGAEIGTCADTVVASIGRGRPAIRTGAFHLSFNLATAAIGLALAPALVALVQRISGDAGVGRQIANAQMLFNVLGVGVVLPFLPWIARALERLIPDTPQKHPTESAPVPAA